MIGGYAQISYGLNYYGTVGSNRDEFVVIRKLQNVDWQEGPLDPSKPRDTPARERPSGAGVQKGADA